MVDRISFGPATKQMNADGQLTDSSAAVRPADLCVHVVPPSVVA